LAIATTAYLKTVLKEENAMLHPEAEFEYEQKCERIAMEIEMLILDGIIAALERLNLNLQDADIEFNDLPAEAVIYTYISDYVPQAQSNLSSKDSHSVRFNWLTKFIPDY